MLKWVHSRGAQFYYCTYSQSTRITFPSLCFNKKGLGNYRDTHYNSGMDALPFRWSLENRTSLGSLIDGPFSPLDPVFLHELTRCCARIVVFSEDAELCFVGRSPEHCFDYLSGLLFDSTLADRLHLLHFSLRYALPTFNLRHGARSEPISPLWAWIPNT